MLTVRTRTDSELGWANDCYAQVRFLPSSPEDLIAVAEADGMRVGLGRLVGLDTEAAELGGMYVLPEFRGRSVATAILSFLLENSPYRQLYCIAFSHLETFYRGFGFQPAPAEAILPPHLSDKLAWCVRTYPHRVSLLSRATD